MNPFLMCMLVLTAILVSPLHANPNKPQPQEPPPPTLFPGAVVPLRERGQILEVMKRVAEYQIAWEDKRRVQHWARGAGYLGLLAYSRASGDPRGTQEVERLSELAGWQTGPLPYHADDHVVGQSYLQLHSIAPKPHRIDGLRARFDSILAEPRTGPLEHVGPQRSDRWTWCDALFMAPPAWAGLTRATGDNRYLEFMLREWRVSDDFLYDREERLYFRDSRYFTERLPDGNKLFWSRGNGWVLAGYALLLPLIPDDRPEKAAMVARFREFADRVVELQPPSGLWGTSLHRDSRYIDNETSGSAFFCHGLAWGVNAGILKREHHGEAALRAWDALVAHVQKDGRLIHVQPIGDRPYRFNLDSYEVYGSGALLLAGEQILALLK
jgi:unsaturated rhamnogalacturonyl hydrolase